MKRIPKLVIRGCGWLLHRNLWQILAGAAIAALGMGFVMLGGFLGDRARP